MEDKLMEAREEFNSILAYVTEQATGLEIHKAEEGIFKRLLELGRTLLELFVQTVGTGHQGKVVLDQDGITFRYLRDSCKQYFSIFGLILIRRAHYRKEGRDGLFPLDSQLNLPRGKYSYLLQDWLTDYAVQTTFESTVRWVKKILGLSVPHRAIQRINLDSTDTAVEFIDSLEPPVAVEEGPILVHSVDCKGIRMSKKYRNPDPPGNSDKPGKMKMACVARSYSTDPHYRDPEPIMDSLLEEPENRRRKEKDSKHCKPRHRRTIASLKQPKSEVFSKSDRLAQPRIHEGTQEKVALMDGERVLWRLSGKHFPEWTEILDFIHVVEKLWIAALLLYRKGSPNAKNYVREQGLALLTGHLDWVIEDLTLALEDGSLSETKAGDLRSEVLGYFVKNRTRMDYHQYLSRGLPIASGIIESTCGNLVRDRMEGAGMSWSRDGAEAMIKLRGIFIDQLWDEFWVFKSESEKKRLYSKYERITNNTPNWGEMGKAA